MMEAQVLSVSPYSFVGRDGKPVNLFRVYIADESGAVGCILSSAAVQTGDIVNLTIAVGRDGKFIVRISQ